MNTAEHRSKRLSVFIGVYRWLKLCLLRGLCVFALPGGPHLQAAVANADPSSYRALLAALKPGDTLTLAPGRYPRLPINQLNGTEAAWITITGPPSGPPAVITGSYGYNAVEISNSSYVAIENLRIDSRGIPGVFGISTKGRENNRTHHIRIENNILVGQNGNQQTDGISTKSPTWGWIIRNNQILGAGTGLYLGDSDGNQPFVAGLIENNLVQDTIGYNMQIKHQIYLPLIPGMPLEPTSTIIRNNVFIKNDQASPDGDRPNVLLGSPPMTGAGALNNYQVYGNYFLHNHREALFQASGRVTVHDNLFIDGPYTYPAVVLRNHDYPLRSAYLYNNTIYTSGKGIYFGTNATLDDAVIGNLVFALIPISGQIMHQLDNVVATPEKAPLYVRSPSFDSGSMDFFPLPGKCQGSTIDLSLFQKDIDYTRDFNGISKAQAKNATVFRGAYAGEGENPGWRLQSGVKAQDTSVLKAKPILVWISPSTVRAGTVKEVTLTGANFSADTVVSITGSGITVSNVKVSSAIQATAALSISAGASPGVHSLSVSTSEGSSNTIQFRVTSSRRPVSN
jgi:hypothetical protein